ncbi:MAG: DUF2949 domain-containing protein [Leptolyngbyaceae cyanobacterium bins.349]|nr:DUF2949 domain-containing protein [Leptolyngbyaceae cyanobacterium bins.349]
MEAQTAELVRFLRHELHISADSTRQVVEQCKNLKRLPVILWQRKLVTLAQLDQVCHWLEGVVTQTV